MSGNRGNDIEIEIKDTLKKVTEANTVPMPSPAVEQTTDSNETEAKTSAERGAKIEEASKVDDIELLKSQLSQIFSLDNFSKDKFLISQLDSDQYISVEVIAQLKAIAPHSHNIPLILDILKTFPNLQVDPSNTRVRLMAPRSIIILREVPQSTPKELIEKLFERDDCPHCVRCEFAGNENWYISFVSEEQAHKAYNHLRENVQTFLGKHIMARIKTSSTFICSTSTTPNNNMSLISMLPFEPPIHHFVPSHNNVPFFQSEMLHPWSPKILVDPYQLKQQRPYQEGMLMNPVLLPKNYEEASPGSPGSHNSSSKQFYQPQPFYHPAYKHHHNYNDHHNYIEHHSDHKNRSDHNPRYPGHENKPPPRFLRQQMSYPSNYYQYPSRHRNDSHYSKQDQQSDQNREQPPNNHPSNYPSNHRVAAKWTGKSEGSNSSEPNNNNPPPNNNHKNHDTNNYQRKRFSERRGSYRSGRRGKDDTTTRSSYKGRNDSHQQRQGKAERSEVVSFQLETNSFPPLPSSLPTCEDTPKSESTIATTTIADATTTTIADSTTTTTTTTTVFCNKLQASYVQVLNSQHNNTQQTPQKQHLQPKQQQNLKQTSQDLKKSTHKPSLGNEKRVSVTIRPSNKNAPTSKHTTSNHTPSSHTTSNHTTPNHTTPNHTTPNHTPFIHSLSPHQPPATTTTTPSIHTPLQSKDAKSHSIKSMLPARMSYAQVAQKAKSNPECSISLNDNNNNNNDNNNNNNDSLTNNNHSNDSKNGDDEDVTCLRSLKSLRITETKCNNNSKQQATSNKQQHSATHNKQPASINNKVTKQVVRRRDQQKYATKFEKHNNVHNKKPANCMNNGVHKLGSGDDEEENERVDGGGDDEVGGGGGDDTDEYDYENYEGLNGGRGGKKVVDGVVNGDDNNNIKNNNTIKTNNNIKNNNNINKNNNISCSDESTVNISSTNADEDNKGDGDDDGDDNDFEEVKRGRKAVVQEEC